MGFGNLGISEIAIIAVLILLFFGPERIPEMARTVGQIMREFRRGVNEIQRELQEVERSVSEDPASDGESRRPPRGRIEPGGAEETGSGSAAGPEAEAPVGEEQEGGGEDDDGDRPGRRGEGGPHLGSSPD